MRQLTPLLIPLIAMLLAGCITTPSATGGPSSSFHGESTISIGTYGNIPVSR